MLKIQWNYMTNPVFHGLVLIITLINKLLRPLIVIADQSSHLD